MKIISSEKYPTYIKINIETTNPLEITKAENWCRQTQCGKRINRHSFAFYTDAQFTMFRLRWEK